MGLVRGAAGAISSCGLSARSNPMTRDGLTVGMISDPCIKRLFRQASYLSLTGQQPPLAFNSQTGNTGSRVTANPRTAVSALIDSLGVKHFRKLKCFVSDIWLRKGDYISISPDSVIGGKRPPNVLRQPRAIAHLISVHQVFCSFLNLGNDKRGGLG